MFYLMYLVRVFANGLGDWGSVVPKTHKMILYSSSLNSIVRYGSRISGAMLGKE